MIQEKDTVLVSVEEAKKVKSKVIKVLDDNGNEVEIDSSAKKQKWSYVFYPESCPDYQRIINDMMIPYVLSPIHDKDLFKDGTPKKAHFHLMLCWNSATTYNAALTCAKMLGVKYCKPVESDKGLVRYMAHIGRKDKVPYNSDDIVFGNGACRDEYFVDKKECAVADLRTVIKFMSDNDITEFSDLIDILVLSEEHSDLLFFVSKNAYLIDKYICSKRCKCSKK